MAGSAQQAWRVDGACDGWRSVWLLREGSARESSVGGGVLQQSVGAGGGDWRAYRPEPLAAVGISNYAGCEVHAVQHQLRKYGHVSLLELRDLGGRGVQVQEEAVDADSLRATSSAAGSNSTVRFKACRMPT